MGKRGIVIGFAEPSLLSRLPVFFLLADRIDVSGLRLFCRYNRRKNSNKFHSTMLITTTNSIENAKVEKYLGVITTNLVIGTGFFSDLTAAFSDIFGGMSGTYREQMDTLYERAYEALSRKATILGANAILGFKIDFDEISGKGKQMFMVSVSGTAVVLSSAGVKENNQQENVSSTRVNIELFKIKWEKRDKTHTPSDAEMNFIMEHGLSELAPSLYDYYTVNNPDYNSRPIDIKFPLILSTLSYDEMVAFVYNDYKEKCARAYSLISKYQLFNAAKVLDILQEDLSLGIELLELEKKEYTREDIKDMKAILDFLDNLPDKGKIEMTKSGMLSSKMVEMYICPEGHKNEKDVVYCEGNGGYCGLNIKGLKRSQIEVIDAFREKVEVLEKLLN